MHAELPIKKIFGVSFVMTDIHATPPRSNTALKMSGEQEEAITLSFVHEAAKRGYTEQIQEALENNKDQSINSRDSLGNTPLHWACSGGHFDAAKLLVQLGADVNVVNQYGDTPLHKAAWKSYAEICELLINNGASPSRLVKNQDNKTPLDLARNFQVQRLVAPPMEVQGRLKHNRSSKVNCDSSFVWRFGLWSAISHKFFVLY